MRSTRNSMEKLRSMFDIANHDTLTFKTMKDGKMVSVTQAQPGGFLMCSACFQHGHPVKLLTPGYAHHDVNKIECVAYCPCLESGYKQPSR